MRHGRIHSEVCFMRLTSVMEAPMRRGKQAATTNVSFQLNVKAITNAVE
jgi:hypothetical protein